MQDLLGEAPLDELLGDPIALTLMARDGEDAEAVRRMMLDLARRRGEEGRGAARGKPPRGN